MPYTTITVTPITPRIGAEIEGIDLSQPLSEQTVDELHDALLEHQPNSIAFWDNRSAQHHAMWDYYPQVRSGYRVTIKGDKPF